MKLPIAIPALAFLPTPFVGLVGSLSKHPGFPQTPSMNARTPSSRLPPSNAFRDGSMTRVIHDCRRPSPTDVAGEERQDGRLAENEAAHEFGMVHCQRERDVRAIGVPHEMRRSGFQLRDQRSQIRNVIAERIDVCLSWWSVGRGETPAVGDDPEARGERLHLSLKGVQISQATMHEDERLSLTALEVMERCLIDLDRADVGATRFRLTSCVREAGPSASSVIRIGMRREGASVIRIISVLQNDYASTIASWISSAQKGQRLMAGLKAEEAATVALRTDLNHTRGGGRS